MYCVGSDVGSVGSGLGTWVVGAGGRSQMLLLGVGVRLVMCRRRMTLSMSFTTVDVPLKLKSRPSILNRCLCVVPFLTNDG